MVKYAQASPAFRAAALDARYKELVAYQAKRHRQLGGWMGVFAKKQHGTLWNGGQ